MKYKSGSGDPLKGTHTAVRMVATAADDYHRPDEKPPGGMRFLLMTWPAPFNDGTVVLISAAPPDLYPSPVTGLPFLWDDPFCDGADDVEIVPLLCPFMWLLPLLLLWPLVAGAVPFPFR